ncbi:MAG TPA: FAD-dependent oxidoreductase [Vicinamibacterales bacterium]|nr:FAD-dependent oxidoreductase [Vicinamibacterales bacterium]
MNTSRVADIVIAGAGMAGVALAHGLAVRRGVGRVVLVDPLEPLSLTSSKGTEAYRNYWPGPDDTMVRFMNRSIDLLDELDRETGQAFELNRRGYVFLTADPLEADRLRQHEGPTTTFVEDAREIRGRYPFVTDRVRAMLHVRRAGYMSAAKLGTCLLERARARGVELVRDEVTSLAIGNQRFAGVELASGSRIDAGAFVLAVGPLLPDWTERLGLTVPIVNELHGKISFDDHAGVIPRDAPLMIWNDSVDLGTFGRFPAGVHLRPRGARAVLGIWTYDVQVTPATFPPAFAPDYSDIVIRGLAEMVPGLRAYRDQGPSAIVDGGYYCKTPDNRPLIGPTALDGVYILGALSGFGIMASQAAAELVTTYLLDTARPDYAGAFQPARFDDPAYTSVLATLDPRSGQL